MSNRERPDSPRKECAVSLRFRILANGNGAPTQPVALPMELLAHKVSSYSPSYEGKPPTYQSAGSISPRTVEHRRAT
jgi:hypothetical protein